MTAELIAPPQVQKQNGLQTWQDLSTEDVAQRLGTDLTTGLTSREAQRREEVYGPNTIQVTAETHWYQVLARQFVDVLIGILMIAALISFAVGELTDAITILAIVVFNGILGFVQEWKAERAIAALKQMLSPQCRVVRDGSEQQIAATALVPGDVVQLDVGERVPADLRLAEAVNLQVDESVLTGESFGVNKQSAAVDAHAPLAERLSMAWAGTAVTNGRAIGIAVSTGPKTEFGRIAELTQAISSEQTPLQRKLSGLGRQLGVFALAVSTLVAVTGWLLGKPLLEMFMTGVSLAVAVVPEGLPAVVTLTMALGIRAMVRRKALLRRLEAAEGLGAATVICTDKTGTLTQSQMTAQTIWMPAGGVELTGVGYDPAGHFEVAGQRIDYHERSDLRRLLKSALLCNHAKLTKDEQGWHEVGEPTEAALVVAAYKAWLDPDPLQTPVAEFSFNSNRKRMTVVTREHGQMVAHVKGAPEVILPLCTTWMEGDSQRELTPSAIQQVKTAYEAMAKQGLRTLLIARRDLPDNCKLDEDEVEVGLTLLGVVGMNDPPRPEVPDAVKLAQSAGIRVFMITGDAPATALAIGQRIGLPATGALTGPELDSMDDAQLSDALQQDVVFARTTPEHKLRIVKVLQEQGEIVGMTGDGVNDAPALKRADIGIAMGVRGTEVARGASDIVLTDDNFSSIVGAIEEGRRQYDNIQKFVRYLLSSNTGEIVAIFLNIVLGGPLILLPVQILWMNLVTDGLTALALGVEPAESTLMQRRPRDPSSPILSRRGILTIAALGTYIGLVTLLLFQYYLRSGDPSKVAVASTVAFTGIILIEKVNVLNFRALNSPLNTVGYFSNLWILVAISSTIGLQAAAVYVPFLQQALHTVPLGLSDWALIVVISIPIFLVSESAKWATGRRQRASMETE